MRIWLEWARNAVVTNKAEQQKDSADIFGEAKPLLSDWARGAQPRRDHRGADGAAIGKPARRRRPRQRHPVRPGDSDTAQHLAIDNRDRILFGALTANNTNLVGHAAAGDHAASLLNVDTTADKMTAANLSLLKRVAMGANPRIRPYQHEGRLRILRLLHGANPFRDLKIDLQTVNKDARPRETIGRNGAPNNPLFQDGDQIYDGVIVRQVPEISLFVSNVWTHAADRRRRQRPRRAGVPVRPAGRGLGHRADAEADVPR